MAIRRIKLKFKDERMSISNERGWNFHSNATILFKSHLLNPINMEKTHFFGFSSSSDRPKSLALCGIAKFYADQRKCSDVRFSGFFLFFFYMYYIV